MRRVNSAQVSEQGVAMGTSVQPPATAVNDWRRWLAGQFDQLGRWFGGRFIVEPAEDERSVSAEELLDGPALRDLLLDAYRSQDYTDVAPSNGGEDAGPPTDTGLDRGLSIAASRVTRHYAAPLTTVALTGLASGVAFDASPAGCTMLFAGDIPFRLVLGDLRSQPRILACLDGVTGVPRDVRRVGSVAELREVAWRGLYADHLVPFFDGVAEVTKIAPALMWTNAAEWIAMVHDSALEYLGEEAAAPIAAECQALLATPALPGLADNPLRDKIDFVPVGPAGEQQLVQTRRLCCLTYLLADRFGRLCQSCPYLPPEDRLALARERHGVPMGTVGGEAERRSIAQGLQRPSIGALFKPPAADRKSGE
jgi:hypothetical protein